MRQVVLDTETTGLDTRQGHRIIEIGAVEIISRRVTDRQFHQYVNPQREIDAAAEEVHGISASFLEDKPLFRDIADAFLAFVDGTELVIHNAQFDTGFINAEFSRLAVNPGRIEDYCTVLDTLSMAKDMHPGQKNNLDALCKRYNIDNSQRSLHGALLDAEILADVYLAMTGGQTSFLGDSTTDLTAHTTSSGPHVRRKDRDPLPVIRATPEELTAHQRWLELLDGESKGNCLWNQIFPKEGS